MDQYRWLCNNQEYYLVVTSSFKFSFKYNYFKF